MDFATDQNSNNQGLSVTAQRMLELRGLVLSEWEKRVRESLPEAETMQLPLLINTLPSFYDNIAQAISPGYPRLTGDGTSLAAEHGGERARLSAYTHTALIQEYQLFRASIFDVFERSQVRLNHFECMTIHTSIDTGIREAVNGFTLVHTVMREQFAAALTHDMRTPLSIAVTALELGKIVNDPRKVQQLTDKALDNLRRMNDMIGKLLNSMALHEGRTPSIAFEQFDILDVVGEVVNDAVSQHGPYLVVHGPSVVGWWGRAELKRVLENIVNNAFKYGRAGVPVTIRVEHAYERVSLSVHNEGKPIPIEEQAKIFQMYTRVAENAQSHQGWGIGLPYVRSAIESHGGSVVVDSSKERGTTFVVDFPQDARSAQR